jgi:hypothetical protein
MRNTPSFQILCSLPYIVARLAGFHGITMAVGVFVG